MKEYGCKICGTLVHLVMRPPFKDEILCYNCHKKKLEEMAYNEAKDKRFRSR